MAPFVKLAFSPTTIKLYSFSKFNLKLPLTHMTQLPLWFALTVTQIALIFQSKIRIWPGQLHSIPLPLPHLLIVLMAQQAKVGGRKEKQSNMRIMLKEAAAAHSQISDKSTGVFGAYCLQ